MKIKLTSLIFFLLFITSFFAFSYLENATANTTVQNSISVESIFAKVDTYFKDTVYGGYYPSKYDTNQTISSYKFLGDYIPAVNALINLYKLTNNNSYLNQVPYYLNLINNFKEQNNTYVMQRNADWTTGGYNYLTSVDMAYLLSMYSNLYKVTNNQTYLNSALGIYNALQTYFYDSVHGGYYTYLDPTTFSVIGGYLKTTTYNAIIAQAYLDLYENTLNTTILMSGFNLLNQTVTQDYDSNYGYFIPYLDQDTNTPLSYYTNFQSSQQLNMAIILLKYENLSVIQNLDGFSNQTFINISQKIYTNTLNYLLYNDSLLMLTYDVSSNSVTDYTIDIGAQLQFYDYLLLRKDLGLSFYYGIIEQNLISNALSLMGRYIGQNSHLFLRSANNQITAPWYDYAIINYFYDLQIHSSSPTLFIPIDNTSGMPVVHNNVGVTILTSSSNSADSSDISTTSVSSNNNDSTTSISSSSITPISSSLGSFSFVILFSSFFFIMVVSRRRNFNKKNNEK